jgi:hypothetical protein
MPRLIPPPPRWGCSDDTEDCIHFVDQPLLDALAKGDFTRWSAVDEIL